MIGHILQRAADDLVFVVQRHRRFQAFFFAARVAQNGQKQQLEIAADKIAAVGIHIFGLADDLAQLGRLGGRQVEHPVRQPRGKLALQIKADREEAGRHVQIRILHMPLLRAKHHELALMQLDAVAVHNAVQRAAVDVRQLEHGVLLALEQEAALHLAIKQRIDLADAQAVAELEILGRRHGLEHLKLRARRLCQPDGALCLIRQNGKLPPRRQADRLIEIKIRRLPFPAHGKHRHAQLEIQIDRSGTLAVKA